MSKELDEAYRDLEKLVSWYEYYSGSNNPIQANKTQKEIEDQKRIIKAIKDGKTKKIH